MKTTLASDVSIKYYLTNCVVPALLNYFHKPAKAFFTDFKIFPKTRYYRIIKMEQREKNFYSKVKAWF